MKNRSRGIGQGTRPGIVEALGAVGELLAAEGETVRIVVVGGAALILRGLVSRLTEDVDIIAVVRSPGQGARARMETPDPLPPPLLRAAARVARDYNLAGDWMNSAVGAQWKTGLPPGFEKRLRWMQFGGLGLGVAHRLDLIFLKLYAAVDSEGPQSVHYQDLLALRARRNELAAAAEWVKTQDVSAEFAHLLREVLDHVAQDQPGHHR
jgi:hypothetical protein